MNYVHLKRWLDCKKEQAFGIALEQKDSRKSTLCRCCGRHLFTDLLTGSVDTLWNTASPRQVRVRHKISVDLRCTCSTFLDTPDNQRLTATTVTGGIDAFHGRLVGASTAVCVGKDVTASVPAKL